MDNHIVKIEDDFEIIDCDDNFIRTDSYGAATETLPESSKQSYLKTYAQFEKWKNERNATRVTEDLLLEYFKELSMKNKPTSLWAYYSMLKSTLRMNGNVDLATFRKLIAFLKCNSSGYEPAKTKAFSEADFHKFLFEACDELWLDVKVAFIFAACGGMRSHELPKITINDITSHGDSLFLVRIPKTKDRASRSFTIADKYYSFVRKYADLRSPETVDTRFFVNYRNEKCTCQVIGKNKFNSMPRRIATFLKLEEPHSYSGNSFKRTLSNSTRDRNRCRSASQISDNHYEKETVHHIPPLVPIVESSPSVQQWYQPNQPATVQDTADVDVFEISLLGDCNETETTNTTSTAAFDSFNNNPLMKQSSQKERKMRYIDTIHGVIELPNIIFQIINTEFFQRLRNLKQLGASSYVFPGTTHTRFEHSIGVCHLIDKFLSILERNSSIKVDAFHRKCVMIAGLLHDVGHGPFSHMWDQFVHQRRYKYWNHEDSSCDITRHIFAKHDIKLSSNFQEHSNGIEIIVAMIIGNLDTLKKYLTKDQMYLSEIVNNKFCFIDVDKWDYILRDSYYLNNVISIPKGFERVFAGARVTKTPDGITHISYHLDDYHLVHELFENRSNLHGRCYQHPEIIGIEHLLVKAFLSAEDSGFVFQGVKLSEAHMHPEVYQYLDDSIIQIITICNDARLKESQDYLRRVRTRDLYPIVGMSSQGFEIPSSNGLAGQFISKERKIPTANDTMPVNLILHDDNGEIAKKPSELYPKYILYYTKQVNPAVLNEAKLLQK